MEQAGVVSDSIDHQIVDGNRRQPARNPLPRFFEFRTIFGRGLQAGMEGQNESMYLKTWEVEIEW